MHQVLGPICPRTSIRENRKSCEDEYILTFARFAEKSIGVKFILTMAVAQARDDKLKNITSPVVRYALA